MQAEHWAYRHEAANYDLRWLKFVDESCVNIAMTRLYGRALRGERVVGSAPQNYGENVTMLGALSAAELSALMTVSGSTDGTVFVTFVREVLAPTRSEGDIVVLNNLGAHRAAVETRGAAGLPAAVVAGYEPDRKVLLKDQNLLAGGQSAHARGD